MERMALPSPSHLCLLLPWPPTARTSSGESQSSISHMPRTVRAPGIKRLGGSKEESSKEGQGALSTNFLTSSFCLEDWMAVLLSANSHQLRFWSSKCHNFIISTKIQESSCFYARTWVILLLTFLFPLSFLHSLLFICISVFLRA